MLIKRLLTCKTGHNNVYNMFQTNKVNDVKNWTNFDLV